MSNETTTETKIDARTQCLVNIAVFDELLSNPEFKKQFQAEYNRTPTRSEIRKKRAEAVEQFLNLDATFQGIKKTVIDRVVRK